MMQYLPLLCVLLWSIHDARSEVWPDLVQKWVKKDRAVVWFVIGENHTIMILFENIENTRETLKKNRKPSSNTFFGWNCCRIFFLTHYFELFCPTYFPTERRMCGIVMFIFGPKVEFAGCWEYFMGLGNEKGKDCTEMFWLPLSD